MSPAAVIHRFVRAACPALLAAVITAVSCAAHAVAHERAALTAVSYERDNASERIVLVFDRQVEAKSAVLPPSPEKRLPVRLYVDFYNALLTPQVPATMHPESPLLRKIRIAQRDPSVVRLVCETAHLIKRSSYTISRAPSAHAMVITFPAALQRQHAHRPSARAPARPAAGPIPAERSAHDTAGTTPETIPRAASPPPAETPKALPKKTDGSAAHPRAPSDRCIIVIDPGHGAKDPGAIGVNGIQEKDVSLALARELKQRLDREPWCTVVMTRSSDTFLSLAQRAAIANTHNADLLISLHTNAHDDPSLTGIETYYLDFSSDENARRVAARENFTTPEAIGDLEMILFDLLQSTKINASSILAGYIHNAILDKLSQRYGRVRNLGVKHAPLRVLIDSSMPCVIIEAGFISNPREARLLTDRNHQRLLAEAIAEGIRSFKSSATFAAMRTHAHDL